MYKRDILQDLRDAFEFVDRHPVPIAIAMTPSFKDRLTSHPSTPLIKDHYNAGLTCYIWDDLPEHYRVYFNQTILDRDIAVYER